MSKSNLVGSSAMDHCMRIMTLYDQTMQLTMDAHEITIRAIGLVFIACFIFDMEVLHITSYPVIFSHIQSRDDQIWYT